MVFTALGYVMLNFVVVKTTSMLSLLSVDSHATNLFQRSENRYTRAVVKFMFNHQDLLQFTIIYYTIAKYIF